MTYEEDEEAALVALRDLYADDGVHLANDEQAPAPEDDVREPAPITVKRVCYICNGSLSGCFNCVKGYTSEERPMTDAELENLEAVHRQEVALDRGRYDWGTVSHERSRNRPALRRRPERGSVHE